MMRRDLISFFSFLPALRDGYAFGYEEGYLCNNTSETNNIETGNENYDVSYSLGWFDGYYTGVDDYVAGGGLKFC